jgi:hypothetical protein
MSQSLKTLRITEQETFRAQLTEVGSQAPTYISEGLAAGEEPLVPVQLYMPLSDARRFGGFLFEWMELKVSTASLAPDPGAKP